MRGPVDAGSNDQSLHVCSIWRLSSFATVPCTKALPPVSPCVSFVEGADPQRQTNHGDSFAQFRRLENRGGAKRH